jgi:5-methylcytosine-specific restriction endonuclease McrA
VADQRFTQAFREALWRAFGQSCFYCELPLDYSAMEIDHLIPESTSRSDLVTIKGRLGLPSSFSTTGYENLAPACSTCNARKRALPLADGALMIKLAEIAAARPRLLKELERRRVSRDLDAVLRLIHRSIDHGKFSVSDIAQGIAFLEQHPDGFHGASGRDTTPPSPETRFSGMHFLDEGEVLLSPAAEMDLDRLGYTLADVLNLLRGYGSVGEFGAKRLDVGKRTPLYSIQVRDGLRLVFTPESDSVIRLISVLRRASL